MSKQKQSKFRTAVHYLSCQPGCQTYCIVCSLISALAVCLKALASAPMALSLRVETSTLTTSLFHGPYFTVL